MGFVKGIMKHQVIAEQTRHGAKLDAILRALERADLARDRDRRPTALSRDDREILKRILPAVAGARGSERFTSRDLVEGDRPAIRLAVGQMTAKQIGKLFARADRIPIDGLMVQRDGVDFHVTAWRIVGRGSV